MQRPDVRRMPEPVRVWLLGGFRVSVGTRIIEDSRWRLRKAAALVKLLVLTPGHRLYREQVMDLLWPTLVIRPPPTTCAKPSMQPVGHSHQILPKGPGT